MAAPGRDDKERLSGQRGMFLDESEELQGITESIMARLRRKGNLKAEEARPEDVIRTNVNEIKVEEIRMVGRYWQQRSIGSGLE